MAGNSVLAKMAVQISANTAEFNKSLSATQNNLKSFTSGVSKIAGSLGVAFGVQQVASFTLEVAKLAGEAEGVRAAFERLPESTKLMNDLKRATGGTVSELDLMKRAVQASNFDISLEALPRLLEFATLRAQQTGQSVNYLVDSIITGIGRKSPLILDNLGISAVALKEKLGDVSIATAGVGQVADAVGKIAAESLNEMAGFSDNASTKIQRLEASWENVKVAIGDAANSAGLLGGSIDAITGSLDLLASKDLTFLEKLGAFFSGPGSMANAAGEAFIRNQERVNKEQKKQEQIIREVDRAFKEFNGNIEAYGKVITTHIYRTELLAEFAKRLKNENKEQINTYSTLVDQIDELNKQFETATNRNDQKALKNIGDKIKALNAEKEALDKLRQTQKEKDPLAGKFQFLPDLEAEGSTNLELRNEQTANSAKEWAAAMNEVATSAEFAGGKLIQLEAANGEVTSKMKEQWIDLSPIMTNALSGIGEALGSAIAGSATLGESLLKVLGGVLSQLGQMLIAAGIGVEAFKESLKSLNGAVAIAAGVALIALGAVVSSGIKNLGSSAGSSGGGSRVTSSQSNNVGALAPRGTEIQIGGEWRIQGEDLVYILNRQNQLNGRTRG